ncbi:hypothetical protein D3C81_1912820 [compost metagenome]
MHYAPGNTVRMPQQGFCQWQIIITQRIADGGAADAQVAFTEAWCADHLKAEFLPGKL